MEAALSQPCWHGCPPVIQPSFQHTHMESRTQQAPSVPTEHESTSVRLPLQGPGMNVEYGL